MLKSHSKTIFETLGRNPIHPFPARMAPGIALEALSSAPAPIRVLDPMAGSGTVLAVARASGHQAIGFDIDPLAVLLSRVWTTSVDADEIVDKAREVLDRAKALFPTLSVAAAYPEVSDEETRRFIRYWFDDYARRQLTALSTVIARVRDESIRAVLWCGFSRLIITKSAGASRAMDLSHSRPHRAFDRAPVKPFARFLAAVGTVSSNCLSRRDARLGPYTSMRLGDARRMKLPSAAVDLVLTSPPYLNAIDYMRCSKFSLVWMGYNIQELRRIRGESVGAEAASNAALETDWVTSAVKQLKLKPVLSNRDDALLSRYIWDMGHALAETSRVLKHQGKAVYVVGDSTIRKTFVPNSRVIQLVAERSGLQLESRQSRALPENRRYMPPPNRIKSVAMDTRMRREVVLVFQKP